MSKRSYAAMMGGAASAGRVRKSVNKGANRRRANVSAARAVAVALRSAHELKGVDTDIAVADVLDTTNTNVDVIPLNLVVPGSGSFNRVGRKIRMQSIRLWGVVTFNSAPAATSLNTQGVTLRMVVVFDKQPSGVLPTFDTIFGHTLPDGTEATVFNDPLRYDNTRRFRVLRDKRWAVNPGTHITGGTGNVLRQQSPFDEFVKLNLETVYSGQSSPQTIADISSGALYVIFRASANTAGEIETVVTANSFARLRYTD